MTPDEMARHLLSAASRAPKEARDEVADAVKRVQAGARRNAAAANRVHARGLAARIGSDIEAAGTRIEGEVGYDKVGQGNLGAILEYANGRTHNAPQRNLGRALDVEEPRFPLALGDMGERLIR